MEDLITTELDLPATPPTGNGSHLVLFDLETSGVGTAEVIQIAALVDDNLFSRYILPVDIPDDVRNLTGLSLSEDRGSLLLYGDVVETTPRLTAWEDFVKYLQTFDREIILVGHNVHFDYRFLLDETEDLGLFPHVSRLVVGFVDTKAVMKNVRPGLDSYKLTTIATELGIATDKAHSSVGDVEMLQKILKDVPDEIVKKHRSTFESVVEKRAVNKVRDINRPSLFGLFHAGISKNMIDKVAAAGINMSMLRKVYAQDGGDGVRDLLSSQRDGVKLVTKNKNITDNIINYLNSV